MWATVSFWSYFCWLYRASQSTQEKTLHMDITRWSTPKSDWLYSLQPKMEKPYTVSKKHASKVMLKILQARLQQYVNCELPDVQAGFRKGRGTRDQIANICWIFEKSREFQKNIYFCFIDYYKAFDCVDHHKLGKILKEIGIPDHLTCLLRNLYAGQWKVVDEPQKDTGILGLRRRRIQSGARVEAWSLRAL